MSPYYKIWAKTLSVDLQYFAQHLLKYYNPGMFYAIFGCIEK